jgi:hypothetical protein
MPLFNDATWFLLGVALILIVLNFFAHLLRKGNASPSVRVAFIPPREQEGNASPEFASRLDAHVASTNQKISQLHERLVAVESALLHVQEYFSLSASNAEKNIPRETQIIESSPVVARVRKK